MNTTTTDLFDTTVINDAILKQEIAPNYSIEIGDNSIELNKLDPNGWIISSPITADNKKIFKNIITIKNKAKQTIIVINSYAAINSEILLNNKLSKEQLDNCWYIDSLWLSPDVAVSEAIPLALYCAIKEARVNNKDIVLTIKNTENNFPIMTYLKANKIKELNKNNILIGQKVNYALIDLAENLPKNSGDFINKEFCNDMLRLFFNWYEEFKAGSWSQAIINGTLTKEQYKSTLYNLHTYVQYTTRICARAVAHSDNIHLRNNYIEHLRGEINHEILIQKDLIQLGEDVDYLKKHYIPNKKTQAFMILQESVIGFYQDPIMLLACPFVAEGVSANMKPEFVDKLEETVAKWGIKEPKKAIRFVASHVKFDGGDDGHWEEVIHILPQFIKTEHDRQKFTSIIKFGLDATLNSYNSNVDENLIW